MIVSDSKRANTVTHRLGFTMAKWLILRMVMCNTRYYYSDGGRYAATHRNSLARLCAMGRGGLNLAAIASRGLRHPQIYTDCNTFHFQGFCFQQFAAFYRDPPGTNSNPDSRAVGCPGRARNRPVAASR